MASVLVVDDSESYRLVLRLILELEGHRVIEAGTGEDGIRAAARELPDVAFVDRRLPEMTGTECVRVLRTVSPATVVYGLTGSDIREEIDELVQAGARSAHGKLSLDGSELVALVNRR